MDDGLRFVIYDKAGVFRRQLVGVEAFADLVPNGISTAEFVLDDDDAAIPDVVAEGARCAVWFRGKERFRGRVQATPGEGPQGTVTAAIEGDLRKLWDWYGWQKTDVTLSTSPTLIPAEYRVYTGKSEAVFKQALAENFTRLGVPWTVAANHGFGDATVRAEFRMHPLADKLLPLLDADRLIVTLAYPGGDDVVVDVREAATVPGILTIESGVPDEFKFSKEAPTATRGIGGGRGEGPDREFVQVIDAAREATWGDIIETFVDARNTDEGSDITIDVREALAEGAPRVGISTELVETERFLFGTTYDVGDVVHVKVGPVDTTEQISVSITDSPTDGVTVTPHIGAVDTSADTDVALAVALAQLAHGFRDSGRR